VAGDLSFQIGQQHRGHFVHSSMVGRTERFIVSGPPLLAALRKKLRAAVDQAAAIERVMVHSSSGFSVDSTRSTLARK
jgi:hypothetical protein